MARKLVAARAQRPAAAASGECGNRDELQFPRTEVRRRRRAPHGRRAPACRRRARGRTVHDDAERRCEAGRPCLHAKRQPRQDHDEGCGAGGDDRHAEPEDGVDREMKLRGVATQSAAGTWTKNTLRASSDPASPRRIQDRAASKAVARSRASMDKVATPGVFSRAAGDLDSQRPPSPAVSAFVATARAMGGSSLPVCRPPRPRSYSLSPPASRPRD